MSNTETDNLINITEDILIDVRLDVSKCNKISVPIAQLSTLGAGVASMVPAFRTITQSASAYGEPLYRLVNKSAGDVLKGAKDGTKWGAMKTADGASKMAKLQEVGDFQTTMPIDPATMMMAVALFSVEQQLGNIAEMQKKMFSFLEIEKESEIEADIETLSSLIAKYKHNWDNKQFIASNHKMVVDIQRTARKHINSFQKRVKDAMNSKQLFVMQSKINTTLEEFLKDFKYYRLSLFAFSMSSLLEIMLSENFKEDNILEIKSEIEKMSFDYRDVYGECSSHLEKLEKSALEQYVLKGVGATSKAVGKLIGNIPKVKDKQIDEFLLESGNKIDDKAKAVEKRVLETFAQMSNPNTTVFTERMDDLIIIYNHTTDICFDKNNIYLIAN